MYFDRMDKRIEKMDALVTEKKERTVKIAQAVTALRHETGRSLSFILNEIQESDELPHFTRNDYYGWKAHSDKDWKYDEMNQIIAVFYEHKARYGYRRMTLALLKEGFKVNHKTVQRLMNKMGIAGVAPRAKYKSYKGDINGTVKNLLLDKVVNEKKNQTYYLRNFSITATD